MAYIGRGLDKISNVEKLDNLTFDGSSTSFALQKGGSSFVPSSANNILLSIDGVVQAGNFTVSGSTIDFGTAISGSSTCDFILHYGVGLITTPADGTVSLDKLSATGTKDATTFLRGDNTFASAGLSGWSEDGANNNLLPASASAGIYLGVNSATASNLLDDYEEGSFTTTLTSGLGASINSWNYTKIGNFVILTGKVTINSTDGASTHVGMSLPFNSSGRNSVTVNFVSGQNTGDIGLVAYSNNNSSMFFYNVNDNANESNHTNADVSNGDEYYITFTYRSA